MLNDIRRDLRVSNTAFDTEIHGLIEAARKDLVVAGVLLSKANSDTDPLIRRAVSVYVKAHFGFDNPDADRFRESYESLKAKLTLSQEYTVER